MQHRSTVRLDPLVRAAPGREFHDVVQLKGESASMGALSCRPVPQESFTHTAIAAAPVTEVFATLDEPSTWEEIGGVDRVTDPVIDSHGRLQGFSFEVKAGGKSYVGFAKPHERTQDQLMSWRVEATEVRGVTRVTLKSVGDGTEVTVTLEVESKGLLSAMFFPVISSTIGSGLPRSVDEFAQRFG